MSSVFYYTRLNKFLLTEFLVGNSICVFGNVKVELRTIESYSSNLKFYQDLVLIMMIHLHHHT